MAFENWIIRDAVSRETVAETDAKMNVNADTQNAVLYNGEEISRYEYAFMVEYMRDSELWDMFIKIIDMQVANSRDMRIEKDNPLFGHTDDTYVGVLTRQNAALQGAARCIADCIDEEVDFSTLNNVYTTEIMNKLENN